jgi:hypothetical protein
MVAAVVCRQIDAIGLVIGGDNDTAAIRDGVFGQMLFVDAQHVGRGCGVCLHMIIELESVNVAQVARLAHPQDHRFQESVESSKHMVRRYFDEVPRADCALDGFECAIFANALGAAEYKRVIDLLCWALHAMGQPIEHMLGIIAEYVSHMIKPSLGFRCLAWSNRRRPI